MAIALLRALRSLGKLFWHLVAALDRRHDS
jgi:hypothetical protein